VLVMISSMSVPIGNHFRTTLGKLIAAIRVLREFKSVAGLIKTQLIRRFLLLTLLNLIDCSGSIYKRTHTASTLL